jgi:tetratricopeptide (TPR) repeat protein
MRILLVLLWLFPSLAYAQEVPADMERARELYENGARLYDEGLYEEAIAAFEAAYQASGLPEMHFNIANAYERLGKWQQALDSLNRYRAFAPSEERETLDRRMRNLERRIAETPVAPPPVVVVPPVVQTPPPPVAPPPTPKVERRFGPTKIVLIASGLGVAAAGGVGAGWTWDQSRDWLAAGDREAWNRWRPVNNVAVAGIGVGAAAVIAGFVVPGSPIEVGPTSIRLRGRL